MTTILAIDPGKTSGWVQYDAATKTVLAGDQFDGADLPAAVEHVAARADFCLVEGFEVVRAGIYPQTVTAAYYTGRLVEKLRACNPLELGRHEVKQILTDATLGSIRVKNDATAWAALILLHGEESDRKGRRANPKKGILAVEPGALAGITSHSRAALALAVAFAIKRGMWGATQ